MPSLDRFSLRLKFCGLLIALVTLDSVLWGGDWPQFRGPTGMGVTSEKKALPAEIGPKTHLLWKTAVPQGISSPVVSRGRVFLTTMEKGPKVGTVALDAQEGKILWYKEAPLTHPVKGKRLATATPATDGELVVSFFDTSGLHCYDVNGNHQWSKDFGPVVNQFNHAASPLIIEDRVVLLIDHDGDSFLTALDKRTGEEIWRSYRFVFGRNYATPIRWKSKGRDFIVVAGSGMVVGYDLNSGTPVWYLPSTCAVVNPTPVAGNDGFIYVHGNSPSGGAKSSPFGQLIKAYDHSRDESLQADELPPCFLKTFFGRFDSDASGGISEKEYRQFKGLSQPFYQGMAAIKPSGPGEGAQSDVIWKASRSMPRTPSALYHRGVIYVVNEGGVLQSLEAATGKVLHQGRIAARGSIYSSPALGDGKIYIGTRNGEITVVSAEPEWKTLHSAKLDGEIQASSAIAEGRVYFRTKSSLYCFGLEER